MLFVVVILAATYCVVNGVHDAGNAIAAPIVTGAMRPAPAVIVAAVFHVVGALAVGTAVAATIAGIAIVPADRMLEVLGAAVLGALVWSLITLVGVSPAAPATVWLEPWPARHWPKAAPAPCIGVASMVFVR